MIKGDTAVFEINFYNSIDNSDYEIQSGDRAFFTLRSTLAQGDKTNGVQNAPLIQRECDMVPTDSSSSDSGRCIITLVNSDTEDIAPGRYYWDVQLQTTTGIIQTVGPYRLTLKDHVTTGVG